MRTSGSRLSWPITSTMLSAMSIARVGSSETNSTESPSVLITRPRCGGDHVGAAGLEDLDQVADPVLVELVGQRGEPDQVGEADRDLGGVQVGVVGAERLDPGDRGREVPAPGVDQQLLEGHADLLRPAAARCRPGCRWPRRRPRAARPGPRGWRPPSRRAGPSSGRPRGSAGRRCRSRSRPRSTAPTIVLSAARSPSVNAASSPASGKPSARQSRRASSRVTPAASATSSLVSEGFSPRIAPSSAWRVKRGSGSVIEAAFPAVGSSVCPNSRSLIARCTCSTCGMSWQPDPALLAGVGDHQRAAAEHPVDQAVLVGDVADPGQRDVVPAPAEDAGAGDQPAVGDGVRRRQPAQERPRPRARRTTTSARIQITATSSGLRAARRRERRDVAGHARPPGSARAPAAAAP